MTQLFLDMELPLSISEFTPGEKPSNAMQKTVRKRVQKSSGLPKKAWDRLIEQANFDWETGCSQLWEIPDDILRESFGNGNKLFRSSTVVAQHFIIRFVYNNGVERVTHPGGAKHYKHNKETEDTGGTTIAIRIEGYRPIATKKVSVPKSVKETFKARGQYRCVVNGSTTRLDMDHKQGRDYDGLWLEGEDISLYQPLTKHNNMVKKSACKKCVSSGNRFDAKKLGFLVSVLEVEIPFDSKTGCVGCYWHDVKRFHQEQHLFAQDTTL